MIRWKAIVGDIILLLSFMLLLLLFLALTLVHIAFFIMFCITLIVGLLIVPELVDGGDYIC